jgi:autotransporter adhesin
MGGTALGQSSSAAWQATALGDSAKATGQSSLAVGSGAKANNLQDVAIGTSATATGGLALGTSATAAGGLALGNNSSATNGVAINGTTNGGVAISGTANGQGAVSIYGAATNDNAVAIGFNSQVSTAGSIGIGDSSTVQGANSVAIGSQSKAGGDGVDNATAVGQYARAVGKNSTALGQLAYATADNSVALGAGSVASSTGVAVNSMTVRGTPYSVAGGNTMAGTVSVGGPMQTRQITNVAPGQISATSTDAVNGSQANAIVQAVNGITAGGGTLPYVKFKSTLPDAAALGTDSSSVGPASGAYGPNSSSFGAQALSFGNGSTALGANAIAGPDGTTAVGFGAQATELNSVAVGANSTTQAVIANPGMTIRGDTYTWAGGTPAGAFSVGAPGAERQIQNVAAGSRDTDAVNMGQYKALASAIEGIQEGGGGAAYDDKYVQFNSTLPKAEATGQDSSAVGPNAISSGNGSSSFGAQAQATADNTLALGKGAQASVANSVALGAGSTTDTFTGNAGTVIRGNAYSYEGAAPVGVVSVGAPGQERVISNVAAGTKGTDAVNFSQLQAVQQSVENLNVSGGGSGPITNVTNVYNSVVNKAPFFNANSTGEDSKATGAESVAVGGNAVATAANSVSIGSNSSTTGASAVALGYGASATGNNSVALGANTTASRSNEVNVGNRTVGGVSDAVYNDQAVNLGQARQMAGDTLSQANSYTDARSQQTLNMANSYTDARINGLKKEMNAGDAMSMAAGSLVYGEKGYGVAAAVVNGQPALSWGKRWASKTAPGVYYSFKVAGARKTVGASIAMGW